MPPATRRLGLPEPGTGAPAMTIPIGVFAVLCALAAYGTASLIVLLVFGAGLVKTVRAARRQEREAFEASVLDALDFSEKGSG